MTDTRCCEICRKPIEAERLEVVPDTRLCIEHAKAINAYGGEFKLRTSQDRTSKPGSLKRNYGGVSARKSRNREAVEKLRNEYEKQNG